MPNTPPTILSQLDESEKGDILTDEELEEIGVGYGSKEKYEETMRNLASRLSGTQARRGDVYVPVGHGKESSRIKAGTTTVPVGRLPRIKRVNIVGKVINSAGDAASLLSIFRDPRIEIFNIVFASKTGKILAHTAWTSGLPNKVIAICGKTPTEGILKITKIRKKLGADKIWIAHNHPSGNSDPSKEDIGITRQYAHFFKENFGGHLVLDHTDYSYIKNDGTYTKQIFNVKVKNYLGSRREKTNTVTSPETIAILFRNLLTNNKDTNVCAVLDGRGRVVSWNYCNNNNLSEIKKYMRAAGGAKAVFLTNDVSVFSEYRDLSHFSLRTKEDVFLDIILLNRQTGQIDKTLSQYRFYSDGDWQDYEDKKLQFVTKNKTNQLELEFEQTQNEQGKDPPLMRWDNNIKENTMSDFEQNAAQEKKLDPKELAYLNETWQRKVITDALKSGTLSCMPGADGYADTQPAVNLVNGTVYRGSNLLYLKEFQRQHSFPTAEYATSAQIDRAKENNPSLFIIKGQKGVSLHLSEQNDEGEYIDKHIRLFNVAQLNNPKLFKKWAEEERLVNFAEYQDYQHSQHGDAWKPPEQKEKTPGPEIVCSSTDPVKYLGEYLAAVSMGSKFKVSPEQAKEFAQKMNDSIWEKDIISKSVEKQGEYVTNPFKLSKISREANQHCKDVIREIKRGPELTPEQKQEQQQKQTHSRGF